MSTVVIADPLSPEGAEALRAAGHDVVEGPFSRDAHGGAHGLRDVVAGAHGLIVRSETRVDAALLSAADELVIVGRAGVGLDNIDVQYASERGVVVANAPDSNVMSAAELTVALILAAARNIPQAHESLREGRWERSLWTGDELFAKTAGIVGLGRVGRLVAHRLAAFGMRLLAYDPYISQESAAEVGATLTELDELLGQADFVTVHMPKTAETVGLLGVERLALCKPGAYVVNCARGGIVDEAALLDALEQGRLAGAAIDTWTTEPTVDSPLMHRSDVVALPHLGAGTHEAQVRAAVTIAASVVAGLAGKPVPGAVNAGAVRR